MDVAFTQSELPLYVRGVPEHEMVRHSRWFWRRRGSLRLSDQEHNG